MTRIATEIKLLKTHISGTGTGNVSGLLTTATNLVAAINEVKATADAAVGGGAGDLLSANNLSDVANAAAALANLGGLTQAQVDARVQLIVDTAPAALDTLNELAAALGDDPNFAGTVTASLSKRVAVDSVQSFTAPELAQGQANLDVYSRADIGNPTTADFVATLEAGLV